LLQIWITTRPQLVVAVVVWGACRVGHMVANPDTEIMQFEKLTGEKLRGVRISRCFLATFRTHVSFLIWFAIPYQKGKYDKCIRLSTTCLKIYRLPSLQEAKLNGFWESGNCRCIMNARCVLFSIETLDLGTAEATSFGGSWILSCYH